MSDSPESTPSSIIQRQARNDFETALRKGFWHSVASWLRQSPNALLPFDEVRSRLPVVGEHSIGLQQVPLDQIVGSLGRYNDFDSAFLPRQMRTRHRWESIDMAYLQDISLPAVELYKLGNLYFVKDGNHRVSVARERGQAFIDAEVIELGLDVAAEPGMDMPTVIRKVEEADFYRQTGLKEMFPDCNLELTIPGGYVMLLEHIRSHRYFLGLERKAEVSREEAVRHWYEQVYLPLVNVIHEHGILKDYPGRTEGDLYLWVIEHLWYLREELKEDVSLEDAANHFAEQYSRGPLERLVSVLTGVAPAPPANPE